MRSSRFVPKSISNPLPNPASRRGLTAVMAMLFLALATTLGLAMYAASTTTTASASNLMEGDRARSASESGLRWMCWRFVKMNRPKTTVGNITSATAFSLWPAVRTSITTDLASMLTPSERTWTYDGTTLTTSSIAVDESGVNNPLGARFSLQVRQHPLFVGDPLDARYLRVTSTGTYRASRRTLSMDFKLDKKVKFAIVGKVPIQLGRNTLVEGPIGMATPNKYPPIYMLSDFHHLNSTLASRIDAFDSFLKANHKGYDNRVNINDPDEAAKAQLAGYSDTNGDSYIDEYDLFLAYYDNNGDKAVSKAEFTNPITNKLIDPDLFAAMDSLGAPLYVGDPTRDGYADDIIDNRDGYTKIRGQITLATSASGWTSNLAAQGKTIQDMIQGPISPTDGNELPVRFSATAGDIFDLSPSNFDTSSFRGKTGPAAGTTVKTATLIENAVLSAADANTGTLNDKSPFGSTSYQATYKRPVFKNMTFKNVRIPKGLNALFDNCKFEGTTFVEMTTDIVVGGSTVTAPSAGMTWSQQMKSGSFNKDTVLTTTNSYGFDRGNNLRFNNCNMNGPIASDVPTAYTHFTNSWEFTGATLFDNKVDDTATMVAPQTNIEMGSFTDPTKAPSTLVGVVVAGNIDIRGSSIVDGSIIVTGDGAGNTTQGWFGPSDANTDPSSPMPEGGWGRLSVRYNPNRALPDGINIAVDILPEIDSYTEGK